MSNSDKIIKRYIKGIVYEESETAIIFRYEMSGYSEIIDRLYSAVTDFLENADIHESNENRNKREFKIFANAHGLRRQNSQNMFAEVLELVMSNRNIISEYKWEQEKPKNLIGK